MLYNVQKVCSMQNKPFHVVEKSQCPLKSPV
jgi:hypothetical protein